MDVLPSPAVRPHAQIPLSPPARLRELVHALPPPPRGLSERALQRALAFIDAHIGDNVGLADIARAACISRFHFARLFRISTGQSPMEYMLCRRIGMAREQLARGPQKISATAAALGFFDQSHFTRTFRRMTGYSPREYCLLHVAVTPEA